MRYVCGSQRYLAAVSFPDIAVLFPDIIIPSEIIYDGSAMNKRKIGNRWEDAACLFLQDKGVFIRHRNVKLYRAGEIDIVGMDTEKTLLFIEVKYRKNENCGNPAESVDYTKIKNICKCADYYRLRYGFMDTQRCRFDVITVTGDDEITWYKNAFEYVGRG